MKQEKKKISVKTFITRAKQLPIAYVFEKAFGENFPHLSLEDIKKITFRRIASGGRTIPQLLKHTHRCEDCLKMLRSFYSSEPMARISKRERRLKLIKRFSK